MAEAEHTEAATDPDAPRTFTEAGLSWPQELRDFAHALRNYTDLSLVVHARSGDVVRRRIPRRGLWLFHPRHLRRVLRTNARNYPKNAAYRALRPLLGNGLLLSDGELWARDRRIVAPEFREGVVARYLPTIVGGGEELLEEWSASVGRGPRDIGVDMQRLTLRVVARAMFHSDLHREAEAIGHGLEICLRQATRQMLSVGLLRRWMPTPGNLAAGRAVREIDRIVRDLIARGRRSATHEQDVLSRLLVATDRESGEPMADQQIIDEVKTLILAGHETTGLALSWTLYLLAQHPEVEARLLAELRRVLGDRPIEAADVPALVYTRMVLLEAMRLYPPVPAVPR
ncbi:MAG: cytochrome P450, partial [Myxococcales bacterium]|nr:cytochrome P450 [Myxococcales bacterium]